MAVRLLADARQAGLVVDGIGAGFPEYVDPHGQLTSRLVMDWDVQPGRLLGGLGPVTVESDVRCGAIAEAAFGRGPVLAAARQGASAATGIVETAAAALAVGLAWLVQLTDPEAVILGGGLGHAGGPWFAAVAREYHRRVATRPDPPDLLTGALGPAAGIIGAARASQDAARVASPLSG
jgi:predicted NBD/HSP70 family sugar kinase